MYVGTDADKLQLEAAHANVCSAGVGGRVALMQADATHLPLADGSVDAIVTDMPFGKKHAKRSSRTLYPRVFAECKRVLRPGGALVVLTTLKSLVHRIVSADPAWIPGRCIQMNLGGLKPYAHTIERA